MNEFTILSNKAEYKNWIASALTMSDEEDAALEREIDELDVEPLPRDEAEQIAARAIKAALALHTGLKTQIAAALAMSDGEDAALEREIDELDVEPLLRDEAEQIAARAIKAARRQQLVEAREVDVPSEKLDWRSLLRSFRAKLRKCKDVWEIVELLHQYGEPFGILNARYYHLDGSSNTLVLIACAGMSKDFVEQLCATLIVKHCSFLTLDAWDSLWPFKNGQPTLFQVKAGAPSHLESVPGPDGIQTVHVPQDQCSVLQQSAHERGLRDRNWICFPFGVAMKHLGGGDSSRNIETDESFPSRVTMEWDGKLSCDIDPAALEQPGCRRNVMTFWKLVQEAGRDLELYTLKSAQSRKEAAEVPSIRAKDVKVVTGISSGSSQTKLRDIQEALAQYEVTHRDLEYAALAALIAQFFRGYRDQLVAIDGGETNVAIAKAILRDIGTGDLSLGRIVTNNLGVLSLIPSGANFPDVEDTGGNVRRRKRKPGTVIGGSASLEQIRSKLFAASIIATTGIQRSRLMTASGEENSIKRAFMRQSTDVIVPVPSYKWNPFSGEPFFDLRNGFKEMDEMKNLFFVAIIPHEDASQPEPIRRILRSAIHDRFFEGIRSIGELKNRVAFSVVKASFDPVGGLLRPTLKPINVELEDILDLEKVYEKYNRDHRADVRLIACIHLTRDCSSRGESTSTVTKVASEASITP